MKRIVTALVLVTALFFLSIVILNHVNDDGSGSFNVHDISADESEIQIATDLSIGKGTSVLKTLTQEQQIYTLFEVHPYEGEFGIATFSPIAKKDRYKFNSASHSKNLIQVETFVGNKEVIVGVRKGSQIHKLVIKNAQESVEKIVAEGQDFLGIVSFNSSLAADEITVVGYDKLGQEQARTTN
ncbi:hypothetical protein OB236_21770 [Paenibacillus sp. WQ 127069]|uniref:Uncharacterized protein n=1 Tax=Paenibacillus baimaensis TaxID=2982185 RepID=A0ABT2UJC2_9BACL|nr:hypothetical protein [Paenibacillus sp. WQ 127069]MCU6794744.1 hypothetical protein [Paenibacillus sp. WQ 127069]